MKHYFSTIRAVLQDLRDMETKEDIEKMHLCNLPTATAGFAALDRIEARVAKLEYLIACNVDPSNCTDEDAEICRECHKTAFPENYRL